MNCDAEPVPMAPRPRFLTSGCNVIFLGDWVVDRVVALRSGAKLAGMQLVHGKRGVSGGNWRPRCRTCQPWAPWPLRIVLALSLVVLAFPRVAHGYNALVTFGDSYTDTGNAPSSPPDYWNGRFSNGPLWVEDLSTTLGFGYNPGNNYAVSGTESDELGVAISKFPGTADSAHVLFAIWSGANDIANHLSLGYDDSAWTVRLNRIVSSLMTASDLLYQKGARQIVLLNQTDLTRSPDILNTYGPTFRSYILGKIELFNSQLASAIPGLLNSHPGLQVYLVDIYSNFNSLLNNYQSLGFTKATIGALNDPNLSDTSFNGPGANYVFWDTQHPTAKTHALISSWVAAALPAPAPPPTIALSSPQSGARFTAPASFTVTATVSANGWPITQVSLFEGGVLAGTLNSPPYLFNFSSLPIGSYTFQAQASYGSSQVVTSSPIQVNVSPPPGSAPPPPWTNLDIGATGQSGSTFYTSNATFFVTGSGSDIWDVADAFQYAYQTFQGDGFIEAAVTGLQNTDGYAKAGVMLRETLDPGARNVFAFVTPTSGTGFQDRLATNGVSTYTFGNSAAAPYWLKLERLGTNFNGYGSPDGVNWVLLGSVSLPMSSTVLAGLAVSSHNNSLLNTATFSSVSLWHPPPPPPPVPAALSILRLTNAVLQLSVAGTTGATYVCQISTNLVNWLPISTNLNAAGTIRLQLGQPAAKSRFFYRAVIAH
ncbi:MAG TPA: SGNH/GDSL hydrolase family protein [Verrucomicrobiae bacterium]|nr:SGNH/GDSL hydrolase family protein [Verrucomicrobiae bacterium]